MESCEDSVLESPDSPVGTKKSCVCVKPRFLKISLFGFASGADRTNVHVGRRQYSLYAFGISVSVRKFIGSRVPYYY